MLEHNRKVSRMIEHFSEEYNSKDAVLKYSKNTAGYGINYLLEHDYAEIYLQVINSDGFLARGSGLRMLEFGCGAGMNLIKLMRLLKDRGIPIAKAVGTDFSPTLIESACQEAREALSPEELAWTQFFVAANETLISDIATQSKTPVEELLDSFDLILGVNTFRYCHRLGKSEECASDLYKLLRRGGACVMIDMNQRFPIFRSKLRKSREDSLESYLPTLDEYAAPFARAGFGILEKRNFCWIPHSAGPALVAICRALSPLLNLTLNNFAMRCLIIAKKPD